MGIITIGGLRAFLTGIDKIIQPLILLNQLKVALLNTLELVPLHHKFHHHFRLVLFQGFYLFGLATQLLFSFEKFLSLLLEVG